MQLKVTWRKRQLSFLLMLKNQLLMMNNRNASLTAHDHLLFCVACGRLDAGHFIGLLYNTLITRDFSVQ